MPLREEEARARTKEEEEEEEPRTVTPGSRGGGRGRRWKRIPSGVEIISWKTCNEQDSFFAVKLRIQCQKTFLLQRNFPYCCTRLYTH